MESIDQLGNKIEIQFPPKRIISLVPSQTEFLFDIKLEQEIVGVTRYCIHPEDGLKAKAKIGGTKRFDIGLIKALRPDLIIGNKEENYREGVEELSALYPVWMSDVFTLEDSFRMMEEIGRITDREVEANQLLYEIQMSFAEFGKGQIVANSPVRCAYFIWRKPYMVAAGNAFINEMIRSLGLVNVFDEQVRYPEINPESLAGLNPDVIFLSSEPYSFSEKHLEEFKSLAPMAKIMLVDGEMFSWYGSRLRYVPAYFEKLRKEIF